MTLLNRITPQFAKRLAGIGLALSVLSFAPIVDASQVNERFLLSEDPSPLEESLPNQTAPPPTRKPAEGPLRIARVTPIEGKVDVHLRNNLSAQIVFEATGYPQPSSIEPGQAVTLHQLPTPVTVKISRADGGLLKMKPNQNPQAGVLDVSLDEANPLNDDSGVMRIQSSGQVILNQ